MSYYLSFLSFILLSWALTYSTSLNSISVTLAHFNSRSSRLSNNNADEIERELNDKPLTFAWIT